MEKRSFLDQFFKLEKDIFPLKDTKPWRTKSQGTIMDSRKLYLKHKTKFISLDNKKPLNITTFVVLFNLCDDGYDRIVMTIWIHKEVLNYIT